MSLELLISNWASDQICNRFFIDCDGNVDLTQFDLIFVATLWSGKSQLAFRLLCECMEQTTNAPRVFLLDYDSDLPDIVVQTIPPQEIASGYILSLANKNAEAVGSGDNIDRLRDSLHRLLNISR